MIGIVGLSHATAPIEIRERIAIPRDEVPRVLERLVALPEVGEAMVVSTCNRVEVVVAPGGGADTEVALARARELLLARAPEVGGHLFVHVGTAALRHLFRVAASLDSLVLGEPQILGQVKSALATARRVGTVGPRIDRAVARAIRAAKRVRTETALGAGQVGVPSVALDLARQIFDSLAGRTVVLVGAGEMAECVARLLRSEQARVLVVGRHAERVAEVACSVGGEPRPWAALGPSLVEADVVIASTASARPVVDLDLVSATRRQRRGRSQFFIDLAVPRAVAPEVDRLDGVFCYNVDDFARLVADSRRGRVREADAAEQIVREEVERLGRWFVGERATPVSVALRRRVRQALEFELVRSLTGRLKHLGPEERHQLEVMLHAATKKICHAPTRKLRELAIDRAADGDRLDLLSDALVELFELEAELAAAGSERPGARDEGERPEAAAPLVGVPGRADGGGREGPRPGLPPPVAPAEGRGGRP